MSKIEEIRALLDELEAETGSVDDQAFAANFESLELPELFARLSIICSPHCIPTKQLSTGICSGNRFWAKEHNTQGLAFEA